MSWRSVAGLLLLGAVGCAGSTPEPQAPQEAPAPAAECEEAWSPERKAETPDHHRAAAMKLFDLMDMPKVMNTATESMLRSQLEAMPALAQTEDILRDFLAKYTSWDALKDDFVDMYTKAFTQRELEELAAFYGTPVGKKAIKVTPKLIEQGALLGQLRVKEHLPELIERVQERVRQTAPPPPP